jgi:hypothetical protein
LTGR